MPGDGADRLPPSGASDIYPSELDAHVAAAKRGSQTAFSALLRLRVLPVHTSLRCLLGSEADAREPLTRIFTQAWKELPNLDKNERFDAWLVDLIYAEAGLPAGTEMAATPDGLADDANRPGRRPDESASDAMGTAVRSLVPAHRSILLLRHVFRLSARQVARTLGIPVVEVQRRERVALSQLQDTLTAGQRVA